MTTSCLLLALVAGFANPPNENRHHVWWWFDNAAPKPTRASLPETERLTKTNINPYRAKSKLLQSGLLGPVRVLELKIRTSSPSSGPGSAR